MIVGNQETFAIESKIYKAFSEQSQIGLGFFVLHIGGFQYGRRTEDATLLACSFDAVKNRIVQRSKHTAPFSDEPDPGKIANAFRDGVYSLDHEDADFLGMPQPEFNDLFYANQLIMAPDGDEAFDDGSYILHFDVGDRVRLVAFQCTDGHYYNPNTINNLWLSSDVFYSVLGKWCDSFLAEWQAMLEKCDDGVI